MHSSASMLLPLTQWSVLSSQTGLGHHQSHLLPPPLLSTQATVRDFGQPAQRPRSSPLPRLATTTPHSARMDTDGSFLAQPDRSAVRSLETLHLGQYRRPHPSGSASTHLRLSPLRPPQTRQLPSSLNRIRSFRSVKLEQH